MLSTNPGPYTNPLDRTTSIYCRTGEACDGGLTVARDARNAVVGPSSGGFRPSGPKDSRSRPWRELEGSEFATDQAMVASGGGPRSSPNARAAGKRSRWAGSPPRSWD